MLRTALATNEFMTPEQVLAHYHGNEEKAKQAMVEAELDGRSGLNLVGLHDVPPFILIFCSARYC